jgi:hypothetical protein
MNSDQEMKQWREIWQVEDSSPAPNTGEIRDRAVRQERSLRFKFILEMALAVALLVGSALYASVRHNAEMLLWMVIVWILTIAASAFSIWNWQILWRAHERSVSSYLALYRNRAHATLRAVNFGFALLVFQLLIVIPWFTYDLLERNLPRMRYGIAMIMLAVLSVTYVWVFLRMRARAFKEIRLADAESAHAE